MMKTDQAVLARYEQALMRQLVTTRIAQGGTKQSRTYSHLFVDGKFWGGKQGTLLCRKPFKKTQLFNAAEVKLDLCPACKKRLGIMAKTLVCELRSQELYAVAGGAAIAPVNAAEILKTLIRMRELELVAAAPKPEAQPLFEEDLNQPVRRTELWKLPRPSSTFASTAP